MFNNSVQFLKYIILLIVGNCGDYFKIHNRIIAFYIHKFLSRIIYFMAKTQHSNCEDPLDDQYQLKVADSQLINATLGQFLLFLRILEQYPNGY